MSPTDCVKDRLASYLFFDAKECLDQALLVAERHPIDMNSIKKWCVRENGENVYEEFSELLKNRRDT